MIPMKRNIGINLILSLLLLLFLASCSQDSNAPDYDENFIITDRVSQEPDALLPVYSGGTQGNRVMRLIYQSLMDVDAQTLSLIPVLAESTPEITNNQDTFTYLFHLRKEAAWETGKPLTSMDIEFTIKSVLLPGLDKSGIHTYFGAMESLEIIDEKSFSVSFSGNPFLSEELISTLLIIPAHIYDEENILSGYSVRELKEMETMDSTLSIFKSKLDNMIYSEGIYVGSNAYRVKNWIKQQGISLMRKSDWWGDNMPEELGVFEANPSEINFAIIPDDGTALTAFKNGQLDVLIDVNARDYKSLRAGNADYGFYETTPMSFYYLSLNNKDYFLRDKALREALSLCFDAGKFIDTHMDSMGTLIHGPIHPSSPYFLDAELETEIDIEAAKMLLLGSGYTLKDEVLIDSTGRKVALEILVSEGLLGRTMALILKENAAKIGIEVAISAMKFSEIRKRLVAKDYQITPLSLSTNPFKYDPYQSWHSDNADVGGSNVSGFSDIQADRYIELIRSTDSEEERHRAYLGFQERLQAEIPVIFVAAPVRCVVTGMEVEVPVTPLSYVCDLGKARRRLK